ncbi:MAG TPA: ABC transporter permease [Bacillus bacterium]|uniref:Diguanylate cyclase n=1 Tax=Siminovitchia fordii TaxID=254759 RepID=A0ABQ4K511_9BACI|nr:ABC transporter permease [Siminovitchia fordii]GIN20711.1 diguanylate cyclase [Siminovitchia fordii]HBZ08719.1 ABC transporter permease [Bacillus sp. (in: firmicutes)]
MELQSQPPAQVLNEQDKKRSIWHSPFFKNKLSIIAGIIIIMIIMISLLAPLIAPYDPNAQDLEKSLEPASAAHWFGTDMQGRDILSRVIFGTRTTLLGALLVVLFSVVIGVPLGLISGYFGGKIDNIINRVWDVILAFPTILLAFIIVATFGRGFENAVIALGIVYVPMIARLVRSVTLVEKQQSYVDAARSLGFSHARVIFRHILPNCISPIIVQVMIDFAYAIIDLAALSFLGLGVQPPTADWGYMLSEGREYLLVSPNAALASGFAIMITVISFNLFGDGLQSHLDPKQRKQ